MFPFFTEPDLTLAAVTSPDVWLQDHLLAVSPAVELLARLLTSAVAGGLIGWERETRGRQAGFRTSLLVCLGAATVMAVSLSMVDMPWRVASGGTYEINVDPGRIAYGVMTGIGFLGAGTILQTRGGVRGLTTAAGIWGLAAVGLAAGAGLYTLTFFSTTLILVTLWLLRDVEENLTHTAHRKLVLRADYVPGLLDAAAEHVQAAGWSVSSRTLDRRDDDTAELTLWVSGPSRNGSVRHATGDLERHIQDDGKFRVVQLRAT